MSLADQILQRWGQYGDWNAAGIDQAADLARLLEANGISDLGQLQFTSREYERPGEEWETEAGPQRTLGDKYTVFDASYNGQPVRFLGDVNRDGSLEFKSSGDPGQGFGALRGNGDLLGWSARGGGNTSFFLRQDPATGQVVVVPTWGSSSQETYGDIRGIASIAALAAGGYYAGAGGTTGAAAQGALQGQGLATGASMLGGGDVDSMVKAGLGGAITGAITGGIKGYGAEQGWSPSTTRALAGGANAALRGGDGGDIAKAAAMSWLQNTGSQALNQSGIGGGNMDWNFDTTGTYDPSLFDFGQDVFANPDAYQVDWNAVLNGVDPGTLTGNYWGQGGGGLDWGALLKNVASALNLGSVFGGVAGAMGSRDQQQTSSRDPWAPAQPFLKDLLSQGQQLQQQYLQQPFSPQQQAAYNNIGGLLNAVNNSAGGLFGGMTANASGLNNFDRSNPRRPLVPGGSINLAGFAPQATSFFPRG